MTQATAPATASPATRPAVRAIEFFSGIGGLHYGFTYARVPGTVVAAFDVNAVANQCYAHNFPSTPVSTASIEHLTTQDLVKLNADAWFLSPPCQPFTRGGKGLDHADARSRGLLHLTSLVTTSRHPPRYVFLENVKNFETSECRRILVNALAARGFEIAECLLEPTALGVPNSRLRYYLLARRRKDGDGEVEKEGQTVGAYSDRGVVQTAWPVRFEVTREESGEEVAGAVGEEVETAGDKQAATADDTRSATVDTDAKDAVEAPMDAGVDVDDPLRSATTTPAVPVDPIAKYLDAQPDPACAVPEPWIRQSKKFIFDIVSDRGARSATFTKGYGSKHVFGSGPFLASVPESQLTKDVLGNVESVLALKPRFFSPTEVARLHCFPAEMTFPLGVTKAQQYRLLGNSLNVKVVGELMKVLFAEEGEVQPDSGAEEVESTVDVTESKVDKKER
ncbi:DNA (cytosine-5-)-methyltransferase [Allomyces macrogynus ATCC 38327]|uniref:tRNA (cytosine(38)-C(5))-methyltransferase n=1 Tax=Allomyces macrogynus (strain ATCC 38327) TaxID=578462 RepID=A0A0L0S8V8_ALLM3|nr:DNA (cytosine-5-)-methyltransferase [Allomyces macrogynus ATCC 38327]|eukprot:KNE58861.1 DNA (cytosine-5-)-methyltransferase [Allomyces macrogynus ATCC 38327]